jgi:PAS domain-containing protein
MPQQLEEPYDMTSSGQLHFSAEPEAQWRELFEDSPVMYFMLDPAGTVLAVNAFGARNWATPSANWSANRC